MSHGGCVVEPFGRPPINPNTGLPYALTEEQERWDAVKTQELEEECEICTFPIVTMIFRGTGVCGERCRKKKMGERDEERPLAP